jgi:8-oxo-dGTP pyrophosphatase MutT (NUDIX family)
VSAVSIQPRPLVLGIFRRGRFVLVGEGTDRVKGSSFYRPLGGQIESGESPEQALVREMREELGEEVRVVRVLGELDNRFVFEDRPGWERVHVIEAEFVSADAPSVNSVEAEGWSLRWVDPDALELPLYPDGLADLLRLTSR